METIDILIPQVKGGLIDVKVVKIRFSILKNSSYWFTKILQIPFCFQVMWVSNIHLSGSFL